MIDIHSHILYGIDDGAVSLEMSLEMLRMAVAAGTTHIFTTPHVNRRGLIPSWQQILDKVKELRERAAEAKIAIHIHAGAEVELNYETLRFLPADGKEYCLADSSYILVELTNQSQPEQTEELLFELMLRGYIPVLAHPERYDRLMTHPERILRWMHRGMLTQCNIGSFNGDFGQTIQKRAMELLHHQMICFLGSDAHRIERRNPDVRPAQRSLQGLVGGKQLWDIAEENAGKILADRVLYTDLPAHWTADKPGFLARLFGNKKCF